MTEKNTPPNAVALEVWLMVDEYGSYVVSPCKRALADQWLDEIGPLPANSRTVRLTLAVELPRGADLSLELPAAALTAAVREQISHVSAPQA
jgi:hypothetical protein